jgi:3-oxoacyl-[acyl-carrier-protein] synthase-3
MPEIKQTPATGEPSSNGAGPHLRETEVATPKPQPVRADDPPRARYAHIVGWGYHVPEKVITNQDLAQIVDTNDEWIRTRTGIAERHVAADPKETSASLAVIAARKALEVADVPASKVDLIVCATTTPEYSFPATACLIQDAIGANNAGAFDLSAACSGFVYGLAMARGQIMAGDAEYVLVIGTETLSRIVDWTDRETCILFGDGAGAVLVAASEVPGGILSVDLGSDGSGGNTLIVPAGGSAMSTSLETVSSGMHYIKMDGKAVFRFATRVMATSTRKVLERAGYTPTRSIWSCRIRPISASSRTACSTSSRFPPRRSSSTWRNTATPARPASRSRCARPSKPASSSPATRWSLSALAPG